MVNACKKCGYPLTERERVCPECGYPNPDYVNPDLEMPPERPRPEPSYQEPPAQEPVETTPFREDGGQYIYETALIFWNTFSRNFAGFNGRASRREFWSFFVFTLLFASWNFLFIVLLIPYIAVSVRRMHDAGQSGWWAICPFAGFFLLFKRSDAGPNRFGYPEPPMV